LRFENEEILSAFQECGDNHHHKVINNSGEKIKYGRKDGWRRV